MSSLPTILAPIIGILARDHSDVPDLRKASGGGEYADMYADLLRRAEPSIRTGAHDVVAGELPPHPDECVGWIIIGARYDTYRDEPRIVDLRDLIAGLHRTSVLDSDHARALPAQIRLDGQLNVYRG